MRTDVNSLHFRNISINILPYAKSLMTIDWRSITDHVVLLLLPPFFGHVLVWSQQKCEIAVFRFFPGLLPWKHLTRGKASMKIKNEDSHLETW